LENLKFAKTLSLLPKLKQAGRTYNLKLCFGIGWCLINLDSDLEQMDRYVRQIDKC